MDICILCFIRDFYTTLFNRKRIINNISEGGVNLILHPQIILNSTTTAYNNASLLYFFYGLTGFSILCGVYCGIRSYFSPFTDADFIPPMVPLDFHGNLLYSSVLYYAAQYEFNFHPPESRFWISDLGT